MKHNIENKFNCAKKLWNKFSEQQAITYNNIRAIKQDIIVPIKNSIDDIVFDCISHNYACFAAQEIPKK